MHVEASYSFATLGKEVRVASNRRTPTRSALIDDPGTGAVARMRGTELTVCDDDPRLLLQLGKLRAAGDFCDLDHRDVLESGVPGLKKR